MAQLTFISESIPDFNVGVAGHFDFVVSGGTPPYAFTITQGTLPRGLTLSKTGKLSGTARRPVDTTIFVKVTDHVHAHLTQAFALRVTVP